MDEKATSSSRNGAIPVHSEFRQPRISSSSAMDSRRSVRSLTGRTRGQLERAGLLARLPQARLDRVAVHAAVLHLELVGELGDLVHRVPGNEPERHRLLPPAVLLARVDLRERLGGRGHGAGVLKGLTLPFLPEDLEDHY